MSTFILHYIRRERVPVQALSKLAISMSRRIFDQSVNISVVHQVTLLSLSTSTSCCCCSSDLVSGDYDQLETHQQQHSDSQSFLPIPLDNLLSGLFREEKPILPAGESGYFSKLESQPVVASARADSISWILKVAAFYGFQPLTAYMSISYLDRFLSVRQLPCNTNGWPYQLLSVACLSLAAKMEELMVPSLIDIQMEGVVAAQIFEPKTVQRMELLVIGVLGWRLRSVTPFHFLATFAYKADPTGAWRHGYLASQASDIILSYVSAAAVLCVARKIQEVDIESAELWWPDRLSRQSITGCCGILHNIISIRSPKSIGIRAELHSSSPSSTESSSCSSSHSKRRKLNDSLWA